jgi:hypothetical protein
MLSPFVVYFQDKTEEVGDDNNNNNNSAWLYDVKFVFKKADGQTEGRFVCFVCFSLSPRRPAMWILVRTSC